MRPVYDYERKDDFTKHSALLYLAAHGRGGGRQLDRFFPLFNFDREDGRQEISLLWPLYRDRLKEGSRARQFVTLLPLGLFTLEQPRQTYHALNLAWCGWAKDRENALGLVQTHGVFPLFSWTKHRREPYRHPPSQPSSGQAATAEAKRVVTQTELRLLDVLRPFDLPGFRVSHSPLALIPSLFTVAEADNGYACWKAAYDLFRWERHAEPHKSFRLVLGTWFLFDHYSWDPSEGTVRGAKAYRHHQLRVLTLFWDSVSQWQTVLEGAHSQGLWPLYTYKKTYDGGTNASFLDPLWFWGEAKGEEEHVSAFMKILDYRLKPNGDSRFSFLWRAFRREKRGEAVSTELFPFLHFEKAPELSRVSFLWRVFQWEKRDGERAMRVFFSPRIRLGGAE